MLGRVMAQRRSAETALDYVRGLAPGVKANCWGLAEAAGHESPYRMQALLRSYRWDWKDLRAELPALARAWLPCEPGDLTGPGIAVDETAQLKDGDATACVAPQHAGCTGHVENCVTTVFSAWVTTSGQAWADFDVFMPERWEKDWQRRRAAGIPDKLERKTKPQLAIDQIGRLLAAGLPARWAAFDEVYGRSGALRRFCESGNLAYVAVIPRDFRVTVPVRRRHQGGRGGRGRGLRAALMRERRQRPPVRGLGAAGHQQPAARPADPPPDLPSGRPDLLPVLGTGGHPGDHDVLRHHRRPQVAGGGDVQDREGHPGLGPVPGQGLARGLPAHRPGRPRPVAAGSRPQPPVRRHYPPGPPAGASQDDGLHGEDDVSGADLRIPLGDAPVPVRGGQPCPPRIGAIKLTIAETARIERLARQYAARLITRARLAFCLRWSRWRRRHQARARWHHYSTRLQAAAAT